MTIAEAIALADQMKPNTMPNPTKVRFLSEVEGKIFNEIILKHEHEDGIVCPTYDEDTDGSTEMLVPAPYDMVYVYWLMAQIDHMNQEMDKYNNDRSLFEDAWGNFGDYWNREHMPIGARRFIRF